MTIIEALKEIPNIDVFCCTCCNYCTAVEDYCPSECDTLEKARRLDFILIVECYARYDGDLRKVCNFIKNIKPASTQKKECFLCKRTYFVDDPEFNAEKRICDNCAEQLEQDNPYNGYVYNGHDHDDNDE